MITKQSLRHRIEMADKRLAKTIKELSDKKLTPCNSWSVGYWTGVLVVLEDWLYNIDDEADAIAKKARREAIKEFADRLIARAEKAYYSDTYMCVDVYDIAKLEEEMAGAGQCD